MCSEQLVLALYTQEIYPVRHFYSPLNLYFEKSVCTSMCGYGCEWVRECTGQPPVLLLAVYLALRQGSLSFAAEYVSLARLQASRDSPVSASLCCRPAGVTDASTTSILARVLKIKTPVLMFEKQVCYPLSHLPRPPLVLLRTKYIYFQCFHRCCLLWNKPNKETVSGRKDFLLYPFKSWILQLSLSTLNILTLKKCKSYTCRNKLQ